MHHFPGSMLFKSLWSILGVEFHLCYVFVQKVIFLDKISIIHRIECDT